MPYKKTVFFPVEIGSRDFESRLLLALYLQNRGYTCVVLDDKVLNKIIKDIPASVLFDKSFSDIIYRARIYPAHKSNWFISGIDEEGYHTRQDKRTLARFSNLSAEKIDAAFFWSLQHQKEVIQHTENANWDVKGFPTGSQRFDLMTSSGSRYFHNIYGDLRMLFGDFILHNTSFGCNSNKTLDQRLKISQSNGEIKDKVQAQSFIKKLEFDQLVMNDYMQEISDYSKQSESLIIVRPHPAERIKYYMDFFSENHNVKVIRSGPVEPWLFGCKAVVAHHCTTLLQASISNIPAYNYSRNYDTEDSIPYHYRGRATSLLNRYSSSTLNEDYNIPEDFIKHFQELWSLPSSEFNSLKIAKTLHEQLVNNSRVKKISTFQLADYLHKETSSTIANPKIERDVMCNKMKKVLSMAEAYRLSSPKLTIDFGKLGVLIS